MWVGMGELLPPVFVMGGVKFVSAGDTHALAILEDDSLWMWEYDFVGFDFPHGDPELIKVLDNIVYASAGSNYSMAIDIEGTLWAWGINGERNIDFDGLQTGYGVGRLGDGTDENRDTPVKIMEDVRFVSASRYNTMAIKTDGSLWYWGAASEFLHYSDASDILSPVMVWDDETLRVSLGDWGFTHSGAIKADGSFWILVSGWMLNEMGTFDDYIQFADDFMVKVAEDILIEHYHVAVKKDGSLWQWVGYLSNWDYREPTMLLPPGSIRTEQ
jgi:alpha-tubulin suppressor-like RCC1 family protein